MWAVVENAAASVWAWRHPRAVGAAGRCIGRTDLPVDPRRAKRLAHRIRQAARRHGLARVVWTSPLLRCAAVGRWLQRWGWRHHVDPQLLEMDFGHWDGQPWAAIPKAQIDAWCADFLHHRPGDGESLQQVLARAAAWPAGKGGEAQGCVVAHAGWMLARQWLASGAPGPPLAAEWPAAPAHGTLWRLPSLPAAPGNH